MTLRILEKNEIIFRLLMFELKHFNLKITMDNNAIYISLTTTPYRINQIMPVIQSLKDQTFKVDKIFLNIPDVSRRTGQSYNIPDPLRNDADLTIVRGSDWGPVTKILGCLSKIVDPEAIIIVVDDDRVYNSNMVEQFHKQSRLHPDGVICATGFRKIMIDNRRRRIERDFIHKPFERGVGFECYAGMCYRRKFFDNDIYDLFQDVPEYCILSDDILLANYFAYKNIPIYVTATEDFNMHSSKNLRYAKEIDALHNGANKTVDSNERRYFQVITYLSSINRLYLPCDYINSYQHRVTYLRRKKCVKH